MRTAPADVDALLASCDARTCVVALANPNNPTGTWLAGEDIARLARELLPGVLLLVDEAYAEFAIAPWQTALPHCAPDAEVAVVRTFSKAYGLAGARVGWCLAPTATVEALHALRTPFKTTTGAIEAARAALGDQDWLEEVVAHVTTERRWLRDQLRALGLDVAPSMGNFLLVPLCSPLRAMSWTRSTDLAGLRLRRLQPYGLPHAVRVTIGTREQHQVLLDLLSV